MKNFCLRLCFILSITIINTSFALASPENPKKGTQMGTIDLIALNENTMVIGDTFYSISDNALIHSLSNNKVSLKYINLNDEVAYKTISGQQSNKTIIEMWMLPKGTIESNRRKNDD